MMLFLPYYDDAEEIYPALLPAFFGKTRVFDFCFSPLPSLSHAP